MSRSITGTSDNITHTGGIAAPSSTTTGTLAFWFKPTWSSGDNAWHQFFAFTLNAGINIRLEGLKYTDNNNYIGWFANPTDARVLVADTGLYTAGTWTHIALTWDFSIPLSTLYFNGVSKGTSAVNPSINITFNEYEVGNGTTVAAANPAAGAMADFAYWSVVLAAGELLALAKGARPNIIRHNNLQCWLPLDGLQSPEPDLSGNATNGTITGSAYANGPPVTMFTPRWPMNYDISAAGALSQKHFRFRTDAGAVDAAPTWGADEDAA